MEKAVNSSMISTMDYEDMKLVVKFSNGEKWRYRGVPSQVYDEVTAAASVGKAFIQQIRSNLNYPREKLV